MEFCFGKLELGDVFGHKPSVALFQIEVYPFTFSEGLKPGRINRGIVNEYIRTVSLLNKTIPLLFTKPFYDSFRQSDNLLSKIFYNDPILRPPLWQK
jgi:hypothetical protein